MKNYIGIKKAFSYLSGYKFEIVSMCIFLFLSGFLTILPAQIIGLSIDLISNQEVGSGYKAFIYNNVSDNAYILILLFVVVSMIYLLLDVMYAYKVTKLADKFVRDIQKRIFSKTIRKFIPIQNEMTVGDLITRITKEVEMSRLAIVIPFNAILRNVIPMIWILVVFLLWNYQLALITSIISIPIYFIAKVISRKSKKCSTEVSEVNARFTHYIINILNNIKIIHINKAYSNESANAAVMIDKMYYKKAKLNKSLSKLFPLVNIVKTAATAVVLLLAFSLIQNGTLSSGDAIIVFLYLGKFFNPIISMQYAFQNLSKAEASLKRVFEIENMESEYSNEPGTVRLKEISKIEFNKVSCEIGANKIISDFSGLIQQNSINIIKGESGKGKSTLINLLLGFINLSDGDISINGIGFNEVIHNPDNISVAFQEHNLFNRSIGENIAYNTTIDEQKAMNLLEAFNLKNFIEKYGFDYIISDQAHNISGGERKRLSVIRAIYKKSPLYIFDEPSAELDVDNIERLKKILLHLKEDATVIISTHDKILMEIGDSIISI